MILYLSCSSQIFYQYFSHPQMLALPSCDLYAALITATQNAEKDASALLAEVHASHNKTLDQTSE